MQWQYIRLINWKHIQAQPKNMFFQPEKFVFLINGYVLSKICCILRRMNESYSVFYGDVSTIPQQ